MQESDTDCFRCSITGVYPRYALRYNPSRLTKAKKHDSVFFLFLFMQLHGSLLAGDRNDQTYPGTSTHLSNHTFFISYYTIFVQETCLHTSIAHRVLRCLPSVKTGGDDHAVSVRTTFANPRSCVTDSHSIFLCFSFAAPEPRVLVYALLQKKVPDGIQ